MEDFRPESPSGEESASSGPRPTLLHLRRAEKRLREVGHVKIVQQAKRSQERFQEKLERANQDLESLNDSVESHRLLQRLLRSLMTQAKAKISKKSIVKHRHRQKRRYKNRCAEAPNSMEPANGDASGSADSQKSGQICRDFLRKVCNRGNACRYVHPQDAEKKLEFCHDFQNSICSRSNCKFIHCSKEEENYYLEKGELPTSVDEVGNRGSNRGGAHQEIGLCRDFINGKCSRGARCKFRHQRDDDILDNDPEYGRSRGMRGARGGFGPRDDPYGYDAYPRSAGAMDAYRAISRYGRPGGYGGAGAGHLAMQELEDENSRLRQRVELLRKQVDDLTSTNEVLLQQNATLRTGKADVQLAMM